MRKVCLLLLVAISLWISLFGLIPRALADAKSDYEYQLSQYRRSYAEFTQLKRDYLQNPTLDNQQKSIIVAKQVLLSRDLTKASYARFLADIINTHNTGYSAFQPIITRLGQAVVFYTEKSVESQGITTPVELKKFSNTYSSETIIPDRSFFYGQTAAKIAQLVRFQLDAKSILDSIYPKMPSPPPIQLKARLDEIPIQADDINQRIAALTSQIIPEEETGVLNSNQYFSKTLESLADIRTRQTYLIDQLVDIDINYAQL